MMYALLAVPIAAVTAAFVETIPIRLDDNLSVALSAGGALWVVALIVARHASYEVGDFFETESMQLGSLPTFAFGIAVAANAVVAIAGYAARTVSMAGALCGAVIGIVVFAGLGWQGWTLLLATFVAASLASRAGLARKDLA